MLRHRGTGPRKDEMSIETIADIVEELADKVGVYGAHSEQCERGYPCRSHWTADLKERLDAAFEVRQKLRDHETH